jgi:hypothetical protein
VSVRISILGLLVRHRNGALVHSSSDGYDTIIGPRNDERRWRSVSGFPQEPMPAYGDRNYDAWQEARKRWTLDVYRSREYEEAVAEIIKAQKTEPYWVGRERCAYQGKVYSVEEAYAYQPDELTLLVKHFVLRQNLKFKSIEREIKAFENLDRLIHRDPIPESVRLYVWQRDQGQCVECHRRDGLEFDHIIPVSEGGSATERNIQLLCLRCNRTKGAKV